MGYVIVPWSVLLYTGTKKKDVKKLFKKKHVIYSQSLSIQDVRKKDDMCSHLAKQGWYGRGCLKILDDFVQKPMNLMCDPTFGSTPVMTRTGHQPLGSEPSIATMTTRTIRRSQVRRCRQGSGRKARFDRWDSWFPVWQGQIPANQLMWKVSKYPNLGGGFKYFLFSSLFGEDSHFD